MTADRRARRKGRGLGVAVAIVLALVAVAVPAWYLLFRPSNPVAAQRAVQVRIPLGATTAQIAAILADAGVVANPNMFRVQCRLAKADGRMQTGTYDLVTGMPYGVVIDQLVDGPPIDYATVTIPEGFTIDQIAARLQSQAGIPAAEFTKLAKTGAASFGRAYLSDANGSVEGYLFPKTYRIARGSSARAVIAMMLDQYEAETSGLDATYARQRGLTPHQVVTLASMIEREAKLDKERPLVASVVYNRLARGMKLEIDATIEYVLPGQRFRLRNSDLKVRSPYNTYMYKGLPPGPIASPGLASLKAAVAPARTGYLYYVLTGKDGSHTFCETLDEFLVAKQKSKEVFGK